MTVKIGIARGKGNLTGGNALGGVLHFNGVCLVVRFGVVRKHCGYALRNGAGVYNYYLAGAYRNSLLRRHNNIFIVGQHINRLGGGGFNSL